MRLGLLLLAAAALLPAAKNLEDHSIDAEGGRAAGAAVDSAALRRALARFARGLAIGP